MKRRMISATRVLAFTAIGSIAIAAWVMHRPTPAASPAGIGDDTWIVVPDDIMDARKASVGAALSRGFAQHDWEDPSAYWTMASRCGADPANEREHYRVLISDPVVHGNPRLWQVDLWPRSNELEVLLRNKSLMPPPPESQGSTRGDWHSTPVRLFKPMREMGALRTAMSAPGLWKTQENANGCSDGRAAIVEACVDGNYSVSQHDCDGERAADNLWKVLQQDFPAPPEPEWRTD